MSRVAVTRKPLCSIGWGGGGGGRKLGVLVQTSIKRPPPFFFAELRCKKGGRIIEQVRYIAFAKPFLNISMCGNLSFSFDRGKC